MLGCLAIAMGLATAVHAQSVGQPQNEAPKPRPGAAVAAPISPLSAPRPPHLGQWLTEGGKSRVEVSDCAPAICAKIVWLKDPNDEKGQALRDGYNKNTQMRSRPILGLPLFEAMKPAKNGWEGRIYNPEEGEWYDVNVWLAGEKLFIKGCVLFVCETHSWDRAPVTAGVAPPASPAAGAPSGQPAGPAPGKR